MKLRPGSVPTRTRFLRTPRAPQHGVADDFLHRFVVIRRHGFVAGTKIKHAAFAFALIGAFAAARREFRVNAFADAEREAAREIFATVREKRLENQRLKRRRAKR